MTVTNNGLLPVYVQALTTISPSGISNNTLTAQSSVIRIQPKASTTITVTATFNTTGKYNFTTNLYYSTVVDPSMKLVSALALNLGKGSFNVGK
jgi:hypothetical protein